MMTSYLPTLFGDSLMDVFSDFDRDFFRGFDNTDRALYGKRAHNMMKTDVKETDGSYEVDVDLPGFTKDELHLDLDQGYLTISAEKAVDKNEEKNGRMLRQERYAGKLQRTFYVGDGLTETDVSARFENGVLSLNLPKPEARKLPEKKVIMIEG
jgi:HSP20 family molecular chaperone IbpA